MEEDIFDEARRLISTDRNDTYGHPLDDFSKTALIWQAILGVPVTPYQVALCMVGVKISRQVHLPKRDNLVDAIGYLGTITMIQEEEGRRNDGA